MNVYKTILKRRTIRVFKKKKISKKILEKLVNAGRLAPSARNLQPLEFLVVNKNLDKIFKNVKFGGEIENSKNKPVSYIIILVNKKINSKNYQYDSGLASANIILSAEEEGIGSCLMGAIEREKIRRVLNIPSSYIIDLVIALGYPKEEPVTEESEEVSYWRDEKEKLHVPKRKIENLLHWNEF